MTGERTIAALKEHRGAKGKAEGESEADWEEDGRERYGEMMFLEKQ